MESDQNEILICKDCETKWRGRTAVANSINPNVCPACCYQITIDFTHL
jgi:rubrerythrin